MKTLIALLLLTGFAYAAEPVLVDGVVREEKTIAEYVDPIKSDIDKQFADIDDLKRQIEERRVIIYADIEKLNKIDPDYVAPVVDDKQAPAIGKFEASNITW